ncbi:MAG: hypothetical protein HN380_08470 [Victivallales bacterium]|nr:hypothetical protein [Victivallales bacterium]
MSAMALILFAVAFPTGSVVVDATTFESVGHWNTMAFEYASGGNLLIANQPDALARATVDLPPGKHNVWVRLWDDGNYPGHYDFTLAIGSEARVLGDVEPLFGGMIWQKWGTVDGGRIALEARRPDSFASRLDDIVFTTDLPFTPIEGARLAITKTRVTGAFPHGSGAVRVSVRALEDTVVPKEMAVMFHRQPEPRGQHTRVLSLRIALPDAGRQWPRGETVQLPEQTLAALAHLRAGRYELRVGLSHSSLSVGESVWTTTVAETDMPKPCRAEVRVVDGTPRLFVDGEQELGYAFLMHTGDFDRQYGLMRDAGVRVFTLGAGFDGDEPYLRLLRQQPEALMFPRIGVTADPAWQKANPDECVLFDDGSRGPQSMFSEKWLDEQCERVEAGCRRLRSGPYADHIIGVHLCSGVSAEWQSWGLWSDRRGDFSPAALRAWRLYLTDRYGTDQALTAAWGRQVALAQAPLPTRAEREAAAPPRRGRDWQHVQDFYDFYWRGTTRALTRLAAAAKRGGGRDFLVGFFYGYAIQYGGKMQESQHLGMGSVMACPDIDFFSAPAQYSLRKITGTSTFMSFTESIQRVHGKLWWEESDLRTHLANAKTQAGLRTVETPWESCQLLEREFAQVWTRGTALWWFDMEGGWFDDPAILKLFREQVQFGREAPSGWHPKAEVAVFIDDKSSYRMAPDDGFLGDAITQLTCRLPYLGVPYDTYLLSDIDRVRPYTCCIFPLAFDLTEKERRAIEKRKRAGTTLVFLGPAGIGSRKNGIVTEDPAASQALTGQVPGPQEERTRAFPGWTSVCLPAKRPSIAALREILRRAGVHIWHDQDDAFYAGHGIVALHARTPGTKTLHFPGTVVLRELFATGEGVEKRGTDIAFDLKPKETRTFRVLPVGAR